MEVAEYFLGPEIDAAFAGIAVSQFNDGDALGPKEQQEGNDPKPDGGATVGGDGGNHVQIEDGDDEEQNEVRAAQDALEMWRFVWFEDRGGRCDDLVRQRTSLLGESLPVPFAEGPANARSASQSGYTVLLGPDESK